MHKFIMSISLCALFGVSACKTTIKENHEENNLVVSTAIQLDTIVNKNYVCQINAISHIELRSQERGYLEKMYVDEGQWVKKGTLLFKIMPKIFDAELQKAMAETELSEIEFQSTKKLADGKVVSANELAMAKARYNRAKAAQSLAQVHLSFTDIRAPFDGIIDRFHVRLGSLVSEGDLLSYLSDNSKMWVYFNVPEAEYLDFRSQAGSREKMEVSLIMANNQLYPHKGIVETIEADFNNETGNIAFRATFPNPELLLRHGETGTVVAQKLMHNAMLIPQKATFEVLEKRYVFVVDKFNVVHQREISVAAEIPDLYVIKDGLQKDEKLVVDGIGKVSNNEKISYKFKQPQELIAGLKVFVE